MPLLKQIAEDAVEATAYDPDGGLEAKEIYHLLDVRGTLNEHLMNPLNRVGEVTYVRPRETPLTGEEEVYGQWLSLIYCGHDPFVILRDHADRDSLESFLLSGSGIVNPFITFVIAFIDFNVAPYAINYRNSDGTVVQFNKLNQMDGTDSPNEEYPDRQLEWLS